MGFSIHIKSIPASIYWRSDKHCLVFGPYRLEKEIFYFNKNGKLKFQIDLDRHGPRPLPTDRHLAGHPPFSLFTTFKGKFFCMYFIQNCFICRRSDSTVPEDAGIEPRTAATLELAVRRSNHWLDLIRMCQNYSMPIVHSGMTVWQCRISIYQIPVPILVLRNSVASMSIRNWLHI